MQQCYCKWGVFKMQIMWMCYSSVLDYPQFYYGFVEAIHQRCFWMALADGACGHEQKVCMHKTRIIDVALACRRVGLKRVKVVSSCNIIFYDHFSSCRQEALLQRTTFVLNAYICGCSCLFWHSCV